MVPALQVKGGGDPLGCSEGSKAISLGNLVFPRPCRYVLENTSAFEI